MPTRKKAKAKRVVRFKPGKELRAKRTRSRKAKKLLRRLR